MSLCLEHRIYLMSAGLPRAAALEAKLVLEEEGGPGGAWDRPASIEKACRAAEAAMRAARAGRPLRWPSVRAVAETADRARRAGIALHWLGEEGYPEKLAERLAAPPPWIWLAGEGARCSGLACSIVGSRKTPAPFLAAARRLGRALAEAGAAVVSGLAEGADSAAHSGAAQGKAGTLALPACGLLQPKSGRTQEKRWSFLSAEHLYAPFSAGIAIRRNSLIAALGEGLVLVASDLNGGSSYAVRWALGNGSPVWCFEAGGATPPANRQLLRANRARPLSLADSPDQWVATLLPALKRRLRRLRQAPAFEHPSFWASDPSQPKA